MADKVFIIAEAGVNHNGCAETAKEMIKAAAAAGADAVKFQTFKTEAMVTLTAEKADYQKADTPDGENQFQMIKKLELDMDTHKVLMQCAADCGILFMSSPFDIQSVDDLYHLGLRLFKVPSGEITNLPYLQKLASLNARYIISTGMSTLEDIRCCMDIFKNAGCRRENITLLHVNTQYPTPFEDVNLRAMPAIGKEFGVDFGYSDHTLGIEIPIAAAALGAKVIEKHFTLDKSMKGPDHAASLEPHELKAMVEAVRNIEKALGDGIKRVTASESINLMAARKSIVAARDISKGEIFDNDNLAAKRPGTGISPMRWKDVVGRKAVKDYRKDEQITFE